MARKRRNQKNSADLPGTIYLNKNRYWWKVRLADQTSESEKAIVRMETKIEYIIKGVDEIKSEVKSK